jgi:dipeptidyl aminopeptidase/acylaminoacyl peptidase
LIWSTTGDPTVPTTMSYAFYHALRENPHHPPVRFVQFVAPSHGPDNPVTAEDILRFWLGWFDRYLK